MRIDIALPSVPNGPSPALARHQLWLSDAEAEAAADALPIGGDAAGRPVPAGTDAGPAPRFEIRLRADALSRAPAPAFVTRPRLDRRLFR